MNAETPQNDAERYPDELLRLLCGEPEGAEVSASLRQRLARDDELRAQVDASRELLGELQDALHPEPLPQALVRRIHDRVDYQTRAGTLHLPRRLLLVGLAAAAALALAVVLPLGLPPSPNEEPAALSANDAAEIVAAWALLGWNEHLDYSIERVSTDLDHIEKRIRRGPGACTDLPWGPEDDWDVPPDNRKGMTPLPEGGPAAIARLGGPASSGRADTA